MLHWTGQLEAPRIDCHVSVAAGYRVYSFGGYCTYMIDTSMMIDVHVFNTVTLCWEKLPPVDDGREEVPSMRERHTAVLIGTIVYIWGGVTYTVNYCNMLYAFDVNTHRWSKPRVSGTIPEARYNHSACVLEKSMYIYGGYIQLTGLTNGIHRLDTDTMVWTLINTGSTLAPVSLFHSATFIGTKMFVFGGHFVNNNISVFDTETNRWLSTRPAQLLPKGCRGHSAFAYDGELYIFGDCNTSGLLDLDQIFNYLWKFTPETFSWRKVEPIGKGPTWMTRVCCCMVGDRVVLLGRSRMHNHLYILDLSPSLKTLCKLAVTQYRLDLLELPHDIRWELAAMTTNRNRIKFGTEM